MSSAWIPTAQFIATTNIFQCCNELNIADVTAFHRWSTTHFEDFWRYTLTKLNIHFVKQPDAICDLTQGVESPRWLPGAKFNIVDSCFHTAPHATAIIYQDQQRQLHSVSFANLERLCNQVANSLVHFGIQPGQRVAIIMPMTVHAVAIYLGIIKMGGVVVSIADSFSSQEMAERLRLTQTTVIFTQASTTWQGKQHLLYQKIRALPMPSDYRLRVIVEGNLADASSALNADDLGWDDFLQHETSFTSIACDPMTPCHLLFSSGTTAAPKVIVWNHTTPIKAASDAFYHHNLQMHDRLAWPTNLGWMMGPWLVFAAFINQCSIALYCDAPKDESFGRFIAAAEVTMLGVVPTLVASWRQSRCMEACNWHSIKLFSSTGECSNADDMSYLMALAGHKPIIEYCGGTEIGGAYLSSTVVQTNYPALFSTPTMGLNITILDEHGQVANLGEVAIIPPSMGLSNELWNADHHQVYFANMPRLHDLLLRRHGDLVEHLPNGYYKLLGRADDTMNLGGIKISAAEIERVLCHLPDILEVAAIAVAPAQHGPSQLIIYASSHADLNPAEVRTIMQQRINQQLNPLFKIHEVIVLRELPKTVSNKIMRRRLRELYLSRIKS